jgi:S-ribosylhomocysteine lyase
LKICILSIYLGTDEEKGMDKIASFTVDHNKMKRGIYVSRKDYLGDEVVTSFDIRMKEPNREPVLNIAPLHSIEHLGATFLRNHEQWGERVIYFGPMGCRTGNYLLVHGDVESREILPLVQELFSFIENFEGEIPGAKEVECGNALDHNLKSARWEARKFREEVLDNIQDDNLSYPE